MIWIEEKEMCRTLLKKWKIADSFLGDAKVCKKGFCDETEDKMDGNREMKGNNAREKIRCFQYSNDDVYISFNSI